MSNTRKIKLQTSNLIYLLWASSVAVFEFTCFARVAKPFPLCGPTNLPQMPNQLHYTQNNAHQVLFTIYVARLLSLFTSKSKASIFDKQGSIKDGSFVFKVALSICSPSLPLLR